jgi:hypothetical protein
LGAGLASRPQDRNVVFVGIRCREQICCKNRRILARHATD